MPTRLSQWCDRLIEAGWLAILLLVPLFFQTTTARVFEPDKMLLVRSLALLMGTAWLVRWLDGRLVGGARAAHKTREARLWQTPARALLGPVALTIVAAIVATGASIAPRMSWLGSYQRGQGVLSLLAALILFALLLTQLRRRDQVDRLVTALLLGSVPAALFAITQWLGVQPGVWTGLFGGRVFGTLGNPIFLGGYLLLVIPLTLARLTRPATPAARGLYGVALATQSIALVLTLSRGPWLGLAAGLVFLALALAAAQGRRSLALGLVGVTVVLALVVGALNLPAVRDSLVNAPAPLRRVSQLADFGAGSTGAVRLSLWDAAARVMGIEPLRLPIGYGPETNWITLTANASSQLRYEESPDVTPDRSHNEAFDRLIETGLLGLAAYLWLCAAGFYVVLRRLGIGGQRSPWRRYALLTAVTTLVGGGLPWLTGQVAYIGIGLSLGLVAGLGLFLLIEALAGRAQPLADSEGRWLLAALLAALVGHFVEISVGPDNAVGRTLFWALLGVAGALAARPWLVGVETVAEERAVPRPTAPMAREKQHAVAAQPVAVMVGGEDMAPPVKPPVGPPPRVPTPAARPASVAPAVPYLATPPLGYAVLVGLMLITLAYALMPLDNFAWGTGGYSIVWFLALSWLLGSALVATEGQREAAQAGRATASAWPIPALGFGALVLFVALRQVTTLAGGDALAMLWLYLLLLAVGVVLLGMGLPRPAVSLASSSPAGWAVFVPLAVIALAVIVVVNILPIRADMYLRAAQAYAEAGDAQTSLNLTVQAFQSQMGEPVYAQRLAETLSTLAQASPTAQQRDQGFEQAVLAAELAANAVPAHGDFRYNVGHAYLLWAQATQDQTRRSQLLAKAAQSFQQATQLNPNAPDNYNEWALASMLANQPAEASQSLLLQALQIDPRNAQAYFLLGRLYQSQNSLEAAEQAYRNGIQLAPKAPQAVTAYSALGDIYQKSNRLPEAIAMTQKAVELAPDIWVNHLNLALLYQRTNRLADAMSEAQLAYNLAPGDAKQRVVDIISQLQQGAPRLTP